MISGTQTVEQASSIDPNPPAKVKHLPGSINVGKPERAMSAIAGGALALYGLQRRGLGGLLIATVGGMLLYRGASGHCNMYKAFGFNTAQTKGSEEEVWERGIKVEKEILVDRSPEELYRFWRRLDNLPRFMEHLTSVTMVGDRLSHWVAEGPAGAKFEWSAEIINDVPDKIIAWKSLPEADVDSAGSVRFERSPGGAGTVVRVNLQYRPPVGSVGASFAKLLGAAPEQQMEKDLVAFKELAEAGEIAGVEAEAGNRIRFQ
jgi:uncharacterized membrane protein